MEINSKDIYFIVGLSQREAPINLEGTSRGSDLFSVQNYIDVFCAPGTQKIGSCVPITHIHDFTLQELTSTIVRIAGSSSLHLATRNQMRLAVDCTQGFLYDWCSGVVPIMRKQLSDCKRGRQKKFRYSSILVAFFFFESTRVEPCHTPTSPISTSTST